MRLPRRHFLVIVAASVWWADLGRLFGLPMGGTPADWSVGVRRWVDTLLPRDGSSPAASELQVHQQIVAKAAETPHYTRLLRAGMQWADKQARDRNASSFLSLHEAGREAIVAQAEAMGTKTMPGMFFYQTLKDARQFYYEHAASWPGVGFPHAPQPLGFPDYAEAPD
ncbi:gluconate 2-dehydrogenase subunit 3 family protein [Pelagicoccus sp. SDUM812005]|uniref:gluconate 2-dehydrogenase subunit 3 family protein n=1 Tax=Pelagicoccus sp. SDUM812005 TaxID=3041257 RepID=UPI0028120875|nr:gluconate 2-dehydrogenase subunit 3 family protein [Pelagicoccus sp. SDUM812005]